MVCWLFLGSTVEFLLTYAVRIAMLQYELKGFKQVYKLNQGHDKEIDRESAAPMKAIGCS